MEIEFGPAAVQLLQQIGWSLVLGFGFVILLLTAILVVLVMGRTR